MPKTSVLIGPTLEAGRFRVREIGYPAGFRQTQHFHETMGVTLVIGGWIREVSGPREEIGGALSVVVKPAGVEHANEVGTRGARTLQIVFDPASVGGPYPEVRDLDRWRWLHGGAAAGAMLVLLKLARGLGDPARTPRPACWTCSVR